MKIVAVDVGGKDDGAAEAAVARAVALAGDADRLLLFGHAAVVAGRMDQQEREGREGAWLDNAAAWLLNDEVSVGPPARPAPKPLMKATAVVAARAEALLLPRSERVLEMAGSLLVMAVPTAADIDAIDNAHLWLVGGDTFSVNHQGSRAVVTVGDRVVVITLVGGDAAIVDHGVDGSVHEQSIGLQVSNRMSVRGLAS